MNPVVLITHVSRWQWPLTQAQPAMSDPKSKLSTRVEVFTRATADALNRAIGEVLDARNPWQLLYRLSRIGGHDNLIGVAMAQVMGHVALGLCVSERPASLAINEIQLPAGSTLMLCPIGCAVTSAGQGVLMAIFEPVVVA